MKHIAWIAVLLAACIENNLSAPLSVETAPEPIPTTPPPEPAETIPPPPQPCDFPEQLSVELVFPARVDCPWGVGDNLTELDEFNRARAEEVQDIVLPDGARMCDLEIHSTTADLLFDDHVTITLDDVMLVGGGYGYDVATLPVVDDLPRFDWSRIVDRPFLDRNAPYWCLGQPDSVCVLPVTERAGPLDVELSEAATDDLMRAMVGKSVLPFRLITFGDNDADDCAHTDLALEVNVYYALP